MNFSYFQLSIICLACVFITSVVYLVVGGFNGTAMAGFLKNMWNKLKGGSNALKDDGFPNTLEGFGYNFNQNGEMLDAKGHRFQFVVREDDPAYNQRRYVALGDVVTEHLYDMMEKDLKMERVHVPVDAKNGEAQSFIFRTKDSTSNDNLMVLIHGSGAVRAGQWSRKLIINDDIDTGSQLPYIRKAVSDGYGVIVMNPNLNEVKVNGKDVTVRGSETPEKHGVYVWRHFVQPAKALNVAVVAHSYGGVVACSIAHEFMKDWRRRVFSVVFTDSVHMDRRGTYWDKHVRDFMKQRAVNFLSSDEPLNTQLRPVDKESCLEVSAGTPEHERTSHACIASAFQFIRNNYANWTTTGVVTTTKFLGQPLKYKSEL